MVPPQHKPTEDIPRPAMAEGLDEGVGRGESMEEEEEGEAGGDEREAEKVAEQERDPPPEERREGETHAEGGRETWGDN